MMAQWLTAAVFLILMSQSLFDPTSLFAQGGRGMPIGGVSSADLLPVLTVMPREVDFGAIGPGEEAKSVVYLRNVGSGTLEWSTEGPAGWVKLDDQRLSGVVGESPEPVRVQLLFQERNESGKSSDCTLVLSLEGGGRKATFQRVVPMGALREQVRIQSQGGTRTLFLNVRPSEHSATSLLSVEPLHMDFGKVRPGEQATRRIMIRNRGKEPLKWRAVSSGKRRPSMAEQFPRGRYISFQNAATAGSEGFSAAAPFKDTLEFSGTWGLEGGYPATQSGEYATLRYRFTGTGIRLYIQRTPEGDPLLIYLNDQFVTLVDGYSERQARLEVDITENQPDGPHVLGLVSEGGRMVIEGVRIYGKPLLKGPPGWINIFPDSGMTTRETDYVNIVLNAPKEAPGGYAELVHVGSNGGDAVVEVYMDVVADTQPRVLDVHRYLAGSNYLYTTNPQAEASRLQIQGYRSLGIAFRLFAPGTPGTTEFLRWFNPVKGDHFYSSDPAGGGKPLAGYILEGSIGNIATFRLAGTRELYRWYHPASGRHFYTTDQNGEGLGKKGYRFDGIAGFVR
ncbi:MAG: hypothetical protein AB1558_02495 [Thermodesulfobacteriota bacterium]